MDVGVCNSIYNNLLELPKTKGVNNLIKLFTEVLNYKYQKFEISKDIFSENIKNRIKDIKIISEHKDFKIFFIHLDKITNTLEREIIKKLESNGYIYGLFIFSDENTPRTLHFVNVKYEEKKEERQKIIRRMVIEEGGGFRTYSERLLLIEIKDENLPSIEIQKLHDEAFDVDKVTEEFFNEYKEILGNITDYLSKYKIDKEIGRHFAIQLLNRMIFIYFIQKKKWLVWEENKHDPKYLYNLFKKYKEKYKTKESNFYRDFLEPLFFYAFNQNSSYKILSLPKEIEISYSLMPYLNGGLFTKNKYDEACNVLLKDEIFENIFENLLERFNFTISEDLPFDIEVAVDPEMLGKVYESLVHGEEEKERRKAGIFYTPRIEIDYMVKMSLVENLHNNCGIDKEKLIKFIFSEDEEISISEEEKYKIREHLKTIKILDPAVGSGSFLVRTMNILMNLFNKVGYKTDKFDLRKSIIKNSLFGVDVMDWAVKVAELRLWLNLLIDIDKDKIDIYTKPLLPNLSFKIRQGDSLVQEILEKEIPLRDRDKLSSKIKNLIDEIIKEKKRFFDGESDRENIIKKLEKDLLRNIFEEKVNSLNENKKKIDKEMKNLWDEYSNRLKMFGENEEEKRKFENSIKKLEEEKEKNNKEKEELETLYNNLIKSEEKEYFLWDIDFSDVFAEKGGFDIVIGNPPYVRQEMIGPPLMDNPTREDKDEYKKKLQNMVDNLWKYKVGGRCDLYVYFYFLSLSLLNEKGTFCFINSNSWLDVDFGKYLQEFLLNNFEVKRIIDNQVKRSFKEADINTVLVLINNTSNKNYLNNKVKFVMYKKPFEDAIKIENEILIEKSEEIFKNDDLRIFPKTQKELVLDGIEGDDSEEIKFLRGKYEGDKWGGKYLRAPDIYFTILEKGKGKFVKLGDIAKVRFGIKTGANEFFYVEDITDKIKFSDIKDKIINIKHIKTFDEIIKNKLRMVKNTKTGDYWLIEEEYLKPVIKSLKECKSILVKPEDLKYKVLMVHKSKSELKKENAFILDYIEWGEKQGFHKRSTCKSRISKNKDWFNLEDFSGAFVFNVFYGDRYLILYNESLILVDHCLYVISFKKEFEKINSINFVSLFNNSYLPIIYEIFGRALTGSLPLLEIMVYEVDNYIFLLNPKIFNFNKEIKDKIEKIITRPIKSIFTEFGFDPNKPIREQEPNPLPDRKALDDIVFDALGLTEEERKEVYWAVAELVQNRLKKAKSI